MGPARYHVGVSLFLIMIALPIKMYLRWIFNLKYIVNIQEFSSTYESLVVSCQFSVRETGSARNGGASRAASKLKTEN